MLNKNKWNIRFLALLSVLLGSPMVYVAINESSASAAIGNAEARAYSVTFDKNGNSDKEWISGAISKGRFRNTMPICGMTSLSVGGATYGYDGETFDTEAGLFFSIKANQLPVTVKYTCDATNSDDPRCHIDLCTFTLLSDGTYEFTGRKENYGDETMYIPAYHNGIKVTKLGENLFNENWQFTKVYIPSTINYISAGAFTKTNLKEIYIPSSVLTIEEKAFEFAWQLKTARCGASSKPDGWADTWNRCSDYEFITTVRWSQKR